MVHPHPIPPFTPKDFTRNAPGPAWQDRHGPERMAMWFIIFFRSSKGSNKGGNVIHLRILMIILFEELTRYTFACWRNAKKKPKASPHHGWSPATQPPNLKKKQSNVGNSQCHVYHINQPPVITIFVYRCYGYHSRSWLVYGIVLPTFHLLLL